MKEYGRLWDVTLYALPLFYMYMSRSVVLDLLPRPVKHDNLTSIRETPSFPVDYSLQDCIHYSSEDWIQLVGSICIRYCSTIQCSPGGPLELVLGHLSVVIMMRWRWPLALSGWADLHFWLTRRTLPQMKTVPSPDEKPWYTADS